MLHAARQPLVFGVLQPDDAHPQFSNSGFGFCCVVNNRVRPSNLLAARGLGVTNCPTGKWYFPPIATVISSINLGWRLKSFGRNTEYQGLPCRKTPKTPRAEKATLPKKQQQAKRAPKFRTKRVQRIHRQVLKSTARRKRPLEQCSGDGDNCQEEVRSRLFYSKCGHLQSSAVPKFSSAERIRIAMAPQQSILI
jgi:hypothetical protein